MAFGLFSGPAGPMDGGKWVSVGPAGGEMGAEGLEPPNLTDVNRDGRWGAHRAKRMN